MKTLSKKAKCWLISVGSILLATVLVLTGVGIGLMFGRKNDKPKGVIDPLGFSVDAWDGSTVNDFNFTKGYAGRGATTLTIDSAASFVHFINQVNSGVTFEGQVVYLNKNIDLNGKTISSIGSDENPFKGTFDGGYYTIFNAKVNGNGLFGQIENAEIRNLGVYNCEIAGSQDETFSAGLVGRAKNSNIFNSYVRLGTIKGNKVAGLVGEFEATNATYQITRSFADVELSGTNVAGLVGSFKVSEISSTASSIGSALMINCYSTIEKMYFEINNEAGLQMENVIKPNSKAAFFNWNYNEDYSAGADWCDYKHLDNTKEYNFNFPIQSGFGKTLMTGSFYESVVVTNNGQIIETSNLAKAFIEADQAQEVQINLLVEKIFMESEAVVGNDVDVVINPMKDTEIVRGENNENSFFVSTGESKITLGSNNKTRTTSTTLTIDGNREYIEENNLDSGALVVSYGGEVEIHDNVKLQNNINTTTGHGGAVLVYGGDAEEINIAADIENCSAEFAGGGICVVGGGDLSLCTITNCSAKNGGGIAILDEIGDTEVVQTMKTLYGNGKSLNLTSTQFKSSTTFTSSESLPEISNCSADESGGAIYAYVLSSKKVDLVFDIADATPIFEKNRAEKYGGAIYVYGNLTINSGVEFESNTAYCKGGAIYCKYDAVIKDSIFSNNDAGGSYCCAEGGALWAWHCDISNTKFSSNECVSAEEYAYGGAVYLDATSSGEFINKFTNTEFIMNSADSSWDGAYGGAVYSKIPLSIEDSIFKTNTTYYQESQTGNKRSVGGAIYCEYVSEFSGKVVFKDNFALAQSGQGHGGALYYTKSSGEVSLNHVIKDEESCLSFEGNFATTYAGAVYVATNLTFSENGVFNFEGNYSENNGGAIWVGNTSTVIINGTSRFKSNRSYLAGGAIYSGDVNILGITQFIDNKSNTNGGAILSKGTVIIINKCVFKSEDLAEETVAKEGGAIRADGDIIVLSQVEFYNIKSVNHGGALHARSVYIYNDCDKAIFNSCESTSARAGAIYAESSILIGAKESLFEGNKAQTHGGAIAGRYLTISGLATFKQNLAISNGGAIYSIGDIDITNKIVDFDGNAQTIETNIIFGGNDNGEEVGNRASNGGASYSVGATDINASVSFENNSAIDGHAGALYANTLQCNTTNYETLNINFLNNRATKDGGAVYASNLIISSLVAFKNNEAETGGAIFASGAVQITNEIEDVDGNSQTIETYVTFGDENVEESGNKASWYGGAIYCQGLVSINASVVFGGNYASINGGAISTYGLTNNTTDDGNTDLKFLNNEAGHDGGAISCWDNLSLTNIGTFYNNSSNIYGGAIYYRGSEILTLSNVSFESNDSQHGGAIYCSAPLNISDSSFKNNTAKDGDGGAIWFGQNLVSGEISNSTFTGNVSHQTSKDLEARGGALFLTYNSTLTLNTNNTFKNNVAYHDIAIVNSYGGAICVDHSTDSENTYYAKLIINDLVSFENNGYVIDRAEDVTRFGGAIYSGSSSEDALVISASSSFKENKAGYGGAIYIASGTVNIDAGTTNFENNTAKSHGGAIDANTVNINSGTTNFISNTAGTYGGAIWADAININSGTTDFTSNEARYGGAIRVNTININSGTTNFTSNTAGTYGGAIDANNVKISAGTINFTTNSVKSGGGGAINGSSIDISGDATVDFVGNEANYAGAILAGDVKISVGTINFTTNSAKSGSGGAINGSSIYISGDATVDFVGNQAGNRGGAIYSSNNVDLYGDSTFKGNTATDYGGAVSCDFKITFGYGVTEFIENKSKNGGALHSGGEITLSGNVTFSKNEASVYGGAIDTTNHIYCNLDGTYIFSDNKSTNNGGAIYCPQGNVSINGESSFINNDSIESSGGAIFALYLLIEGVSSFEDCDAAGNGGAIRVTANLLMYESATFTNNTAGQYGGAIFGDRYMMFGGEQYQFTNNHSNENGGAIYCSTSFTTGVIDENGGRVKFNGVMTFTNNSTNKSGGAVYCDNLEIANDVTFDQCEALDHHGGAIRCNNNLLVYASTATFTNNEAYAGGAVFVSANTEFRENATLIFENNSASYQGGALYIKDPVTLTSKANLTFRNNKVTGGSNASGGGAIYAAHASNIIDLSTGNILFDGNNSKTAGGAIYTSGQLSLTGSSEKPIVFNNNSAKRRGGAIFSGYSLNKTSLIGANFKSNYCETDDSYRIAYGGAVFTYGPLEINSSTFDGNKAISNSSIKSENAAGGAVYSIEEINLTGSNTFKNNEVRSTNPDKTVRGAAIYSDDNILFSTTKDNTFENNIAQTISGEIIEGGAAVHSEKVITLTLILIFNEDPTKINDISIGEGGYIEINSTIKNKEYTVYKFGVEPYIPKEDNILGKIFKTTEYMSGVEKSIDLVNRGNDLTLTYNTFLKNWGVVVKVIKKPAEDKSWVTRIYTGAEHTISDRTEYGYDPNTMEITGNVATDIGHYVVKVKPKDGCYWEDGTNDWINILNWRIVYPSIDFYDHNGNYIETLYAVNGSKNLSSEFDKNIPASLTIPTSNASSVFGGWSTEQTAGKKVINSDTTLIKDISNITSKDGKWSLTAAGLKLYQQFGSPTVKVTFDGNGGYYYDDPSKTETYCYMPVGGPYYNNDNIYPQFGSGMTIEELQQLNANVAAGYLPQDIRTSVLESWNTSFDFNDNMSIQYGEEDGYFFRAQVPLADGGVYAADFKTYANGSIVKDSIYTYVIEILNVNVRKGTKVSINLGSDDSDGNSNFASCGVINVNADFAKNGRMIYVFTTTAESINEKFNGRDYIEINSEYYLGEDTQGYGDKDSILDTVDFKVSLFRGTMEEEDSEQYFKALYERYGKKAYWYDDVNLSLPKPYREHYTYRGYLIGGGRPVDLYDTVPINGRTLTADYEANGYTIDYFDGNELITHIPYTIEDEIELYTPEKEGYDFLYWRPKESVYNSDSTQVYWDITQTYEGVVGPGKAGDVVLVAEWKVKTNTIRVAVDIEEYPGVSDIFYDLDPAFIIVIDEVSYYEYEYDFKTTTYGYKEFKNVPYGAKFKLNIPQIRSDWENIYDITYDTNEQTMMGEDVTLTYYFTIKEFFATVKWDSAEHLQETPDDSMLINVEWSIEEYSSGNTGTEQGEYDSFLLNYSEQGQTGTIRHCDIMYISVSSFDSNWGFACAIDLIVDGNVVATTEGNRTFAWIPSEDGMGKNIVIDIVVKQIVEIDIYYQPSIDLVSIGEALGDSGSDYPNMITFSVYYNIHTSLIATMRNSDYEFIGWYNDDEYTNLCSDENPFEFTVDGSISELYLRVLTIEIETELYWEDFIGVNQPEYIELSVTGNYDDDEKLKPTLSDARIGYHQSVILTARKGVAVELKMEIDSEEYFYDIDMNGTDGAMTTDNVEYRSWEIEDSEERIICLREIFHIEVYRNDHASSYENLNMEPDDCDTFNRYRLYYGKSITFTSTGVDDGYKFEGWYFDAEFTQLASSSKDFVDERVENSYSLYQKIVLANYTITFDEDGGDEVEDITYTIYDTITLPTPAKVGHTFKGWKLETAIDGWEAGVYEAETEIESGKFGDITLVAQWEINTYTADVLFFAYECWTNPTNLNFQITGGSANKEILKPMFMMDWTATYSTSPLTITVAPVETQYSYSIKFSDDNGKNTVETTSFDWIPTSDATITIFVHQIYNVNVVGFDGLTVYNTSNETEFSQGTIKHGSSLELQVVANKAGYHFDGWYQDNTYSTVISDLNPYEITVTSDVTLYPHIAPNDDTPYVVNHHYENLDGSYLTETENLTGTTDSEVTPELKPREGFIDPELQTVTINGNGSTVVDYYYERAQYTLTLDGDDGIESVAGAGTYYFEEEVEISAVALEGYAFIKWTGILESTNNPATIKMPAGDVTLTATTEVVACTITIIVNNADYGSVDPTSVNANYFASIVESGNTLTIGGKTVTATANESTDIYDYEFDSWSGLKEEVDGDMTITANFKQIAKAFTITYDLDGGTADNPESYTIETETFTLNNPTLEGYEFAGWIGTDLDELTQTVTITQGSTGNREYTAKWYVNVSIETENANGSTNQVAVYESGSIVGTYNESFKLIKGGTYSFNLKSMTYSSTQILRIYFDDGLVTTTNSTANISELLFVENETINAHKTIKFEYLSAYIMTVSTPKNTIEGISVKTVDEGDNIVISTSAGYMIAIGSEVRFEVDSTPAETAEYLYNFIGFNYVVGGETVAVGVSGGNDFENIEFVQNTDYQNVSGVGTYTYLIPGTVQITEIKVLAVVNKVLELALGENLVSGTITICSQYGFNKVIDQQSTRVVLYSGTWTVVSMPEGYQIVDLEKIFPTDCTITENNGVITIEIP